MAKDTNPWKTIPVEPLTGPLDSRSQPDQIPFGGWRLRQNFECNEAGKLCRAQGFEKFFNHHSHGDNSDLRDQLCRDYSDGSVVIGQNLQIYWPELATPNPAALANDSYPPFNPTFGQFCQWTDGDSPRKRESGVETVAQPITLLFTSISTSGQRALVIGTQTRLYALNEQRGNVKLIADGLGGVPKLKCTATRFYCAQVGDAVVFTNNFDAPFVWLFGQPTYGCAMRATQSIPSLELIGLTKAAAVYSWKGFCFLGNVEQDNDRLEDLVVWSDEGNPFQWDPAPEDSLAGSFALGYGEKVMAFSEIGNNLVVLSSNSIWIATVLPPGAPGYPINFQSVYSGGQDRTGCCAYRNTVILHENFLYWMSRDGIYRWTIGMAAPERVEWIHLADGLIYSDLSESACDATVGGYNPTRKEYWLSWVPRGGDCATRTLVLNLRYQVADLRQFGASAYNVWTEDARGTIEDFLLQYCGCQSEAELEAALNDVGMALSIKEGTACVVDTPVCGDETDTMPIYSSIPLEIPGTGGTLTEDYNAAEADSPSFCEELGDLTIEDLCASCDTTDLFIFATPIDNCIKQQGGVFGLERFIGSAATRNPLADSVTVCGLVISSYRYEPYQSRLLSGAISFGAPESEKACRKITLNFVAGVQAIPTQIQLRVGTSSQPVDPLDEHCTIKWRDMEPQPLKCISGLTDAQLSDGLRPFLKVDFNMLMVGRFFYVDLRLDGNGGEACFSRLAFEVKLNSQP